MIPTDEVLALCYSLSRAEQCRLIDALVVSMGGTAPVPAFEDTSEDAEDWAALQTSQTKAAYLYAIMRSLPSEGRKNALDWLSIRVNGGGNGNGPGSG